MPPCSSYFGLETKPAAIIGPALLRYNSLAIDFNKRRIYIGPTTAQAPAPPEQHA